MARPQNAPRGLFAKNRIDIGSQQLTKNSTAVLFSGGIRLSGQSNAVLTGNATAVVANAGIRISDSQTLTAVSTGIKFADTVSALPGNVDNGALIGLVSNSTGVALFINSTGTTHVYLNVTSVQPTGT